MRRRKQEIFSALHLTIHDFLCVYAEGSQKVLISRNVTWQYVPLPFPSSADQTAPTLVGGGEARVATDEGREGTSRPGVRAEATFQDDDVDLNVTWVGPSGATDGIDTTSGETPKKAESCGVSIGGGRY